MPQYEVVLVDGSRLRVQAGSDADLPAQLGLDPRQVASVGAVPMPRRAGPVPDLRLFASSLALLLEAGIPLLEALHTLQEREADAGLAPVIAAVEAGQPFSAALEAASFETLFVALVAASERTGQLAGTLALHAAWLAWAQALRQRLVAAAIYPALLLGASGAVVLFLLLFVLPRFAGVFDGLQTELPAASRALLALGSAAAAQPALALGLAAALPLAGLAAWRLPAARAALARAAAHLPGLGGRLQVIERARLYRSLALLLGAGIPVPAALGLSTAVLAPPLRPALARVRASVEAGERLSAALQAQGLATPVALRLMRVGERSGALGTMLERAAAFHDEELQRLSDWVTRTVNPILMLVMGLIIGAIVVLMYLPVFTLVESVG